jgi:hypothetical protein
MQSRGSALKHSSCDIDSALPEIDYKSGEGDRTGLINHLHQTAKYMNPVLLTGLTVGEMDPAAFMGPVVVNFGALLRLPNGTERTSISLNGEGLEWGL